MKTLKTISIIIIISLSACQTLKPKNTVSNLQNEEIKYCDTNEWEDGCIRFENY
jgi:hypothetical protein